MSAKPHHHNNKEEKKYIFTELKINKKLQNRK